MGKGQDKGKDGKKKQPKTAKKATVGKPAKKGK
jgi:hypothetical protein